MPGRAAKVVVTEKQLAILQEFSRSRTESCCVSQRATIIVLAFDGKLNQEIAEHVDLERHAIGTWRRRWQAAWDSLTLLECMEPHKLRAAIRDTLQDAPRPGAPPTLTAEQVVQIIAVGCEPPEQSGRPITQWTHAELRDEVIKRKIVESISVSRIGAILREAACQPHRRKMWLFTKEKDLEVFQQQVEQVCRTYQEAVARHEAHGTHTVCVDEMTGIQALERAAPGQPTQPGCVAREEFEYIRHGTTTLIGSLDVVTGNMIAPTIGPTRTEVDFINHIEQTVALAPDEEWIFIMDTLNIHWSAGLVEWVAQRVEPDRPLGKKGEGRSAQKSIEPQGIPV